MSTGKLTSIMVRMLVPLELMDAHERDVLSRVVFHRIRGLDAEHDKRWRRWWGNFVRGVGFAQIFPVTERHGAFHAMHMSMEGFLFEHQDAFPPNGPGKKAFRLWLKTGAAFGEYVASAGQLVFVPHSLGYEECSDDQMREFHDDALDFLNTPYALTTLWPEVAAQDRSDYLQAVLAEWEEFNPNHRPHRAQHQGRM